MSDATPIATIGKNQREQVRVQLDTFKGARLVDLRVFAAFTSSNIMMPTKKGVSVRVELLPELDGALSRAQERAEEMGWMGSDQ